MASNFQIQEMIHQDADGVVFQALDKQTGRLVALRRFFLNDDVLKELRTKGEDGRSAFDRSLEWLKSLDIPHFQKVLGGGFDALDETPFLVTEWVEGMSLEEAHEQQSLAAGEGERLEAQGRAVLLALPEETRPAICLEEEDILVKRDAAGGLESIFLISPVRYFGALGGIEFKEVDRQAALVELKSRFPAAAAAVPPVGATAAVPQLKSAKQSSGMGMIWGSLAAVLVVAGVGGWLVMSKGGNDEGEASLAQGEAEVAEAKEEVEKEIPVEEVELAAVEEDPEEAPEKPIASRSPNLEGFEFEKKEMEGEVDLFGEEEATEEKPELAVASTAEPKKLDLPVFQSVTEVDKVRKFIGKQVLLEGVVERVDQSGGKKTIWYLEFNRGTSDFMMVAFTHTGDKESGTYVDWQTLTHQKVRVRGVAQIITRGGKRPALIMGKRDALEVLADMTVREVTELSALFQSGETSGEVIAEGTLAGFGKTDESGYLIFEEAPEVRARFLFESDFGSSKEFKSRLGAMKGKKIRVTGPLQEDPQAAVKVVLQIESPGKVELSE